MTSKSDTTTEKAPAAEDELKTQAQKAPRDPVGAPVLPEPATVLDIPAAEPYPTGNPPAPTWAEINGFSNVAS